MKIQHYVAVLFSYLLFLVMAVVAFSKLSKGMTLLHSGASIWEGRSGIISGLLSLGLAYFLWRWGRRRHSRLRPARQLRHEQGVVCAPARVFKGAKPAAVAAALW